MVCSLDGNEELRSRGCESVVSESVMEKVPGLVIDETYGV